ncbi:hypothetical protein C8R46DRAFT_1250718 [Mycena filopes]|nr:hypothetical protein C8R46DRAFT_1250718 [Mycena filopes]
MRIELSTPRSGACAWSAAVEMTVDEEHVNDYSKIPPARDHLKPREDPSKYVPYPVRTSSLLPHRLCRMEAWRVIRGSEALVESCGGADKPRAGCLGVGVVSVVPHCEVSSASFTDADCEAVGLCYVAVGSEECASGAYAPAEAQRSPLCCGGVGMQMSVVDRVSVGHGCWCGRGRGTRDAVAVARLELRVRASCSAEDALDTLLGGCTLVRQKMMHRRFSLPLILTVSVWCHTPRHTPRQMRVGMLVVGATRAGMSYDAASGMGVRSEGSDSRSGRLQARSARSFDERDVVRMSEDAAHAIAVYAQLPSSFVSKLASRALCPPHPLLPETLARLLYPRLPYVRIHIPQPHLASKSAPTTRGCQYLSAHCDHLFHLLTIAIREIAYPVFLPVIPAASEALDYTASSSRCPPVPQHKLLRMVATVFLSTRQRTLSDSLSPRDIAPAPIVLRANSNLVCYNYAPIESRPFLPSMGSSHGLADLPAVALRDLGYDASAGSAEGEGRVPSIG